MGEQNSFRLLDERDELSIDTPYARSSVLGGAAQEVEIQKAISDTTYSIPLHKKTGTKTENDATLYERQSLYYSTEEDTLYVKNIDVSNSIYGKYEGTVENAQYAEEAVQANKADVAQNYDETTGNIIEKFNSVDSLIAQLGQKVGLAEKDIAEILTKVAGAMVIKDVVDKLEDQTDEDAITMWLAQQTEAAQNGWVLSVGSGEYYNEYVYISDKDEWEYIGTANQMQELQDLIRQVNSLELDMGKLKMKWTADFDKIVDAALPTTGVTAGTYGPPTDLSPDFGGYFTLPSLEIDKYGRIISAVTRTITIPNIQEVSDEKVKQDSTYLDSEYPILLAPQGQTSSVTTTSYYCPSITLNPSSNKITADLNGVAEKTNKINTTTAIGSATKPIYIKEDGTISTISYELGGACTKNVSNQTSLGSLNTTSTTEDAKLVPTLNTLKYWDGSYNSNGASNLSICSLGPFGSAAVCNATSNVTQNSTSLVTSGGVYTELNNYLPLAGGAMDKGAVVEISAAANDRYIKYTGQGLDCIASTVGWVMGNRYFTHDEATKLGGIGAYGLGNSIQYYYMGSDYENPLFKLDTSGNLTVTGKINGYTLGSACAKNYTSSVTSGSTSLVTSGAVYDAMQDFTPEISGNLEVEDITASGEISAVSIKSNSFQGIGTGLTDLNASELKTGTIPEDRYTNTKNTAGSTQTTAMLYLIGAPSQATSFQTYSNERCYIANNELYSNGTVVSVSGHTHKYAGSSSVGGAASSAAKLNTNAGSSTVPVYFSSGVPVECNYSLGSACAKSYTSSVTSGSSSLVTSGAVYTALGDYLPLSGGTTTAGAEIIVKYSSGSRRMIYGGANIKFVAHTSGNFVSGISFKDSSNSTTLGAMGGYGTYNGFYYYYMGSSYDDPQLKVYNDSGATLKGNLTTTGADYAEMFEWDDGNPNNEDRRGLFVTTNGEKIQIATSFEDVLGVIAATPSIVGDKGGANWHAKYKTDIFGAIITTEEINEVYDEETGETTKQVVKTQVLNPDYDPNQKYVPRNERPEWDPVGMLGKLVVIDDGTCEINGYCVPSKGGIATKSETKIGYKVLNRLDNTHILVLIK